MLSFQASDCRKKGNDGQAVRADTIGRFYTGIETRRENLTSLPDIDGRRDSKSGNAKGKGGVKWFLFGFS